MKKVPGLIGLLTIILASLACGGPSLTPTPLPTLTPVGVQTGQTAYGFFPSPPEVSLQSVLDTYKAAGQHADVILLQQSIPWQEFEKGSDVQSQAITDISNQYLLAHQNGLEVVFVVDPLNGLNRREFMNLPADWKPSFNTPEVRVAFTNYTLRIVRDFHPHYLGLASEINTYADAYPDDFANYVSLYNEVYDKVNAEAPDTQIFVTFQWEALNNLIPRDPEGPAAYHTNWATAQAVESKFDLQPFTASPLCALHAPSDIPADYYTRLLTRTSKPLAVAEGGFTSADVGPFHGQPQDQVDYLKAIHTQIGGRLAFWIYLLLSDFNLGSYAQMMQQQGHGGDVSTLSLFATVGLRQFDGTPKAALNVWDTFRKDR